MHHSQQASGHCAELFRPPKAGSASTCCKHDALLQVREPNDSNLLQWYNIKNSWHDNNALQIINQLLDQQNLQSTVGRQI